MIPAASNFHLQISLHRVKSIKFALMIFRSALGALRWGCRVSALREARGGEKSSQCLKGTLPLGGTRTPELQGLGLRTHGSPQVGASSQLRHPGHSQSSPVCDVF